MYIYAHPLGGGGVSQLNIKAFKHGCSETFDICGPENMHVYTCMCMYEYCFWVFLDM